MSAVSGSGSGSGPEGQPELDSEGCPPRRRSVYIGAAVLLLAVSAGAVAVASSKVGDEGSVSFVDSAEVRNVKEPFPAPELKAESWLNSKPLAPADLAGKVVVYDFWTYSCVNCLRTTPYLRAWHERYAKDGLVLIGVHSPEFDFEREAANVAAAMRRLDIDYPVAIDSKMEIWNTFNNMYWPAKYITDRDGTVVHFQAGEGGYSETEDVLRTLLGVEEDAPRSRSPKDKADNDLNPDVKDSVSPETFLFNLGPGTEPADFPEPGPQQRHNAALAGRWSSSPIDVSTGLPGKLTSAGEGATVVMAYVAREVNLVMAVPDGKPRDVTVTIDGEPVPEALRAEDVQVDGSGRTFVRVDRDDIYRIILGPEVAFNELRVIAPDAGLDAFAFTFGA